MSPEQDNFEQLRRLLALKRHEQPHPRYFNDFSQQVIARIKSRDAAERESLLEQSFAHAPWLQRVWRMLEAKPILAGAFAVLVCSLVIFGVSYSDQVKPTPLVLIPMPETGSAHGQMANSGAFGPLAVPASEVSSTGGELIPTRQPSLFMEINELQRGTPVPAGFTSPVGK
jgi:hypothetical protein